MSQEDTNIRGMGKVVVVQDGSAEIKWRPACEEEQAKLRSDEGGDDLSHSNERWFTSSERASPTGGAVVLAPVSKMRGSWATSVPSVYCSCGTFDTGNNVDCTLHYRQ
jgi:hypothetical protein